ncbi:hypothetical protein BDV06DRAFT_201685 [Aspergillus oleicola]
MRSVSYPPCVSIWSSQTGLGSLQKKRERPKCWDWEIVNHHGRGLRVIFSIILGLFLAMAAATYQLGVTRGFTMTRVLSRILEAIVRCRGRPDDGSQWSGACLVSHESHIPCRAIRSQSPDAADARWTQ